MISDSPFCVVLRISIGLHFVSFPLHITDVLRDEIAKAVALPRRAESPVVALERRCIRGVQDGAMCSEGFH